jgi:hypothetical protein
MAPDRSRLERSHRSAAKLAAAWTNCATFFKKSGAVCHYRLHGGLCRLFQ